MPDYVTNPNAQLVAEIRTKTPAFPLRKELVIHRAGDDRAPDAKSNLPAIDGTNAHPIAYL
jgi:hypothetical protein